MYDVLDLGLRFVDDSLPNILMCLSMSDDVQFRMFWANMTIIHNSDCYDTSLLILSDSWYTKAFEGIV